MNCYDCKNKLDESAVQIANPLWRKQYGRNSSVDKYLWVCTDNWEKRNRPRIYGNGFQLPKGVL